MIALLKGVSGVVRVRGWMNCRPMGRGVQESHRQLLIGWLAHLSGVVFADLYQLEISGLGVEKSLKIAEALVSCLVLGLVSD